MAEETVSDGVKDILPIISLWVLHREILLPWKQTECAFNKGVFLMPKGRSILSNTVKADSMCVEASQGP